MLIWLFGSLLTVGLILDLLGEPLDGAGGAPELRFNRFVIGSLALQGITVFLIGLMLREQGISWQTAFGIRRQGLRRVILIGIGIGVAVAPVEFFLNKLCAVWLEVLHITPEQQQTVKTLQATVNLTQRLCFGFIAVVLAPITEELLFRGVLYPSIKHFGYPRLALWGTALFFAITHSNLLTFVPLTVFALVMTFLYEYTDNLLAPIVAHSVFNGINFALMIT
jgi:uncharacterized protein